MQTPLCMGFVWANAQGSCGEEAANQLGSLTGSHTVHCAGQGRDQYGRLLAVCSADGFELNHTMVEAGWAVTFRRYSDAYVRDEARARVARSGIWSSEFQMPEDYRTALEPVPSVSRPVAQPSRKFRARDGMCLIKGNRNRRGQWIYHLPGMPYYDTTRPEELFAPRPRRRRADISGPLCGEHHNDCRYS